MHPHQTLIETFYRALAARDAEGMIACYHPRVRFTDEVFDLEGAEAGAMWKMLCERGKDLKVSFSDVEADERSGRAHWDAPSARNCSEIGELAAPEHQPY